MTQENFFNLSDPDQGIPRQLAEGIATRVFPGDQAMLSLVTIEPNAEGRMHSHPEEQWGILLEGEADDLINDENVKMSFLGGTVADSSRASVS